MSNSALETAYQEFQNAINSPYCIWGGGGSENISDEPKADPSSSITKVAIDIMAELPPGISKMIAPMLLKYGPEVQKISENIPPEIRDHLHLLPGLAKKFGPVIKEGLLFFQEQQANSREANRSLVVEAIREIVPELALAVADAIDLNEIKTRLAQQDMGQ